MGWCVCKGRCKLPEFKGDYDISRVNRNAFQNGYYRCRTCEYYIKGLHYCPCCGARLAIAPRNAKSKRQLNVGVARY